MSVSNEEILQGIKWIDKPIEIKSITRLSLETKIIIMS